MSGTRNLATLTEPTKLINANAATLRNRVEKLHPNLPNLTGDV